MDNILAYLGETINLHAITKNKNHELKDQPVGYPKITIKRMDVGGPVTIVDAVAMTEDVDGEYYYRWTVPNAVVEYKVEYESIIDGVVATGYDSVSVREETTLYYTIEGVGNRFDIEEGDTPTLQAQIYKNGIAFAVNQIVRIEIYDDRAEAEKAYGVGVPIDTIAGGAVTHIPIGKYEYTLSSALNTARLYYDKVYYIAEAGDIIRDAILPFYVRKTSVGSTPPATIETAEIKLNIFDFISNPARGAVVTVTCNKREAWYNNEFIKLATKEMFEADANGVVTMDLIETTTLGADVHYIVDIAGVKKERVRVPLGTLSANYKDLPRV